MRKEQIITTNNNQMEEKGMMSRFIHFKKRFVPALSGALMGVMLMSTTCFAAGDTSAVTQASCRHGLLDLYFQTVPELFSCLHSTSVQPR